MNAKDYQCEHSKKGYLIGNVREPDYCGTQAGGHLTITVSDDDEITLSYTDPSDSSDSAAAKPWNTAHDVVYVEEHNAIRGMVDIADPSDPGTSKPCAFLITLDRATEMNKQPRRIHVYVDGSIGTPEDGSFTGDDR